MDENTFYEPCTKQKFKFDHVKQTATLLEPYTPEDVKDETFRVAVEKEIAKYVADHFPQGASAVYAKDGVITMLIAANKYNPGNFWNGRWRSEWSYKISGNTLQGVLRANVHYYEDGNVQLDSDKDVAATVPFENADATAQAIVKKIHEAETEYQTALNESYAQLSDNTFKGLRRALPVTRNKLDWSKILSYKVGSQVAK